MRIEPLLFRVIDKIEISESGCWIWKGATRLGYAAVSRSRPECRQIGTRAPIAVHRWMYQLLIGDIPDGMYLDHRVCRTKRCVNPWHLVVCTNADNVSQPDGCAAIHRAKTHCPKGHEYDETNTRWYKGFRICRACDRERGSGWNRKENRLAA